MALFDLFPNATPYHHDKAVFDEFMEQAAQTPIHIHAMVNQVATPLVANFLGCMGVGLSMSEDEGELNDLIQTSHALYLNLGTPNAKRNQALLAAAKIAVEVNCPIIIDPVMIDKSRERLQFCRSLLSELTDYGLHWRLNRQEMLCLHPHIQTRHQDRFLITSEHSLTHTHQNTYQHETGEGMLPHITGSGCLLGAICACFMAWQALNKVNGNMQANDIQAMQFALEWFHDVARRARPFSKGPQSLMVHMGDVAYGDLNQ